MTVTDCTLMQDMEWLLADMDKEIVNKVIIQMKHKCTKKVKSIKMEQSIEAKKKEKEIMANKDKIEFEKVEATNRVNEKEKSNKKITEQEKNMWSSWLIVGLAVLGIAVVKDLNVHNLTLNEVKNYMFKKLYVSKDEVLGKQKNTSFHVLDNTIKDTQIVRVYMDP